MGALEAALGGGPDDGRVGQASEERRRAQAVVRQVAEAMEERDDALDELDETLEKMRELEGRLRDAEARAERAVGDAKAEVASQREDEQRAVLSALGLAEERAVQMAAECETTREERDVIASALIGQRRDGEPEGQGEGVRWCTGAGGLRAGFAAGLMAYREEWLVCHRSHRAAAAARQIPTWCLAAGGNRKRDIPRARRRGVHGDGGGYPERVFVQLGRRLDADIPVAELAPGQNRSSLTAGAAALARAHERRSLSRSQSLEKGAAADAAANALGGLELFEVPLGE